MNKPIFAMPEEVQSSVEGSGSAAEQELSAGRYDALFPGAEKVSELYRAARTPPVLGTAELVRSFPVAPEVFIPPEYPPLAKLARVHGPVSFSIDVTDSGAASNLIFESGPKLLYEAVRGAVIQWKFPTEAFGVQIHTTIGFNLNCPQQSDSAHD